MKRKYLLPFMILTIVGASLSSCFQDLDLEPAYGLNSGSVYSDPENYIHVLAKLYAGLSMTGNDGPAGAPDLDPNSIDEGFSQYVRVFWNLQEMPTDETICGWNDPGIPELNTAEWVSTNPWIGAMYYRIYFQLTLINEFIRETAEEKLSDRGFSQADIERIAQYRYEARFLRALSYFHALDLFGGNVPFITEEDRVGAFFPEQTNATDLFAYIESELLAVEDQLMDPVVGYDLNNYGRAHKAAAWTLLAKLYLNAEVFTGSARWSDCITYCNKVINQGGYSLDDEYQDLFLADNHTSPEIIFPVSFDGQRTKTFGGTTFLTHGPVGGSMTAAEFGINTGWGGYRTTANLVNVFDDLLFEDDLNDDASKWNLPGNSSWSHNVVSGEGKLLYASVAGNYMSDGAALNASLQPNREVEITFTVTKLGTVDTGNVQPDDGGYVAIGSNSTAADMFSFTANGSFSFEVNTGSATMVKFYGQNTTYELDNVNVMYRDGDDRNLIYTKGQKLAIDNVSNFRDGYAVAKWRNVTQSGASGSDPGGDYVDTDFPMFRLADVYLMFAEAAVKGGGNTGTGLVYINDLRQRANAPTLGSYTAEDVLDERARELYWEGYRRTDLIRYGMYTGGTYLWPWKGGVQDGAAIDAFRQVYPLPQADIVANPNLTQNDRY